MPDPSCRLLEPAQSFAPATPQLLCGEDGSSFLSTSSQPPARVHGPNAFRNVLVAFLEPERSFPGKGPSFAVSPALPVQGRNVHSEADLKAPPEPTLRGCNRFPKLAKPPDRRLYFRRAVPADTEAACHLLRNRTS